MVPWAVSCVAGRRRRGRVAPPVARLPAVLRDAPVHHQHLAERPHHDVLGLQVAVDHAVGVGEGDRLADAQEEAQPLARAAASRTMRVQALARHGFIA